MIDERLLDGNGELESAENFNRVLGLVDASAENFNSVLGLVDSKQGFGTAVNAVAGTDNLSIPTNPTINDTMTIGTKVYTFKETAAADGDIAIGALMTDTQANIIAAVNGTDAINTANPLVTCGTFSADTAAITAIVKGVAVIATTETFQAVDNVFSAAELAGGVDGTVGVKGAILVDATKIYVATDVNTIHDANWKYASLT